MSLISVWKSYTAAPHRVMFSGGCLQLVVAIAWWTAELAVREGLLSPMPIVMVSTWAHAWLMLFGLVPFFMFGFLMTTYPRWMGGRAVPQAHYLGAFLLLTAGLVLFYVGLFAGVAWVLAGVILHGAGIAGGAYGLFAVYRAVEPWRDRRYESHINLGWGFALLAELAYVAWLGTGEPLLLQFAIQGALWLFLIPILVLVAHRMIPFFSSAVLKDYTVVQPNWTFPVVWIGVAGHVLLELVGARAWLFLPDGVLLVLALHHTRHWGLGRSLSVRLLGALHLAFAFLAVGLTLSVIQSLWLLTFGEWIFPRAPLHAVGIGFVGGMVVAMVTRVSRGHSGRPLEMDRRDWYAFLGILAASVLRMGSEVEFLSAYSPISLALISGMVWLSALLPWVTGYLRIYLLPRVDGKPG